MHQLPSLRSHSFRSSSGTATLLCHSSVLLSRFYHPCHSADVAAKKSTTRRLRDSFWTSPTVFPPSAWESLMSLNLSVNISFLKFRAWSASTELAWGFSATFLHSRSNFEKCIRSSSSFVGGFPVPPANSAP